MENEIQNDWSVSKTPFFPGENMAGANNILKPTLRDEMGRFVVGHTGALSKRYETRDALMTDVIAYLEKCNDSKKNPTMTGLALALGFRSRRSLLHYEKESGYEFAFEVISYAKMKIEEFLEERLLDSRNTNIVGLIFNLKNNFDWQDRHDVRMDQRTVTLNGFDFVPPSKEIKQ